MSSFVHVRILVVDDEVDLADGIAAALRKDGYAVDVANSGQEALDQLAHTEYDLLTLDLTLGDMDGREVCRRIRGGAAVDPSVRILMLTARDGIDDRVAGLDDGADDYLVKPFALRELAARVRTLLRRDSAATDAVMEVGPLVLDDARREVAYGGTPIRLTAKEFALCRYFMAAPGTVFSQEHLLEHVWDQAADPFTNTVRVTVGTLRRKLEAEAGETVIETVIGAGYRLLEPTS